MIFITPSWPIRHLPYGQTRLGVERTSWSACSTNRSAPGRSSGSRLLISARIARSSSASVPTKARIWSTRSAGTAAGTSARSLTRTPSASAIADSLAMDGDGNCPASSRVTYDGLTLALRASVALSQPRARRAASIRLPIRRPLSVVMVLIVVPTGTRGREISAETAKLLMMIVYRLLPIGNHKDILICMNEGTAAAFLARLLEIQRERGLNDRQFARLLGVSPPYWNRLRRGQRGRRLSLSFALRVVRALPELALFLESDLPIITQDSTIGNSEEDAQ